MKRHKPPTAQIISVKEIQFKTPPKTLRTDVEDLKTNFKTHGQSLPIIVSFSESTPKKPYIMHSGAAELEAAKLLGWARIKAIVLQCKPEMIKEWAELLKRHLQYDLSDHDLAKTANEMLDRHQVIGAEFAETMGLSKPYTYNLMRWYRDVPNEIKDAWAGQHPLINHTILEQYSHLPNDKALAAWKMRIRMMSASAGPFKPGRNGHSQEKKTMNNFEPRRPHRASQKQLHMLQEAIDTSPLHSPIKQICTNIIRFVLGTDKHVPGITDYKRLPTSLLAKKSSKTQKRDDASSAS